MTEPTIAERVAAQLAPYIGPFNARVAVKTFTGQAFDRLQPEDLTLEHLPDLLEALRPMLNTLAGERTAESVLEQIRREVT